MKIRAVVYLDSALAVRAEAYSSEFAVPCIDGSGLAQAKPKLLQRLLEENVGDVGKDAAFVYDEGGLRLVSFDSSNSVTISADFHGATTTYRRLKGGGKGQMIAKAVGLGSGMTPSVLDGTAGLGGDAFVLASLGCRVSMVERVSAVRALLEDGLLRARLFAEQEDPALSDVLGRMQLIRGDSMRHLKQLKSSDCPDVVYLDPMFPARTKRSLVKKEMRVFHSLVGADPDANQLLPCALAAARYRVVVKRPKGANSLNDMEPNHTLNGKSNRYDIYTKQKMSAAGGVVIT
jgi:16S rRNA (guanine1516-N2)-methyltransferase